MFNVNNKSTRTMSMTSVWCFYCQLWTYFIPYSTVFSLDFEQVNVSWVNKKNCSMFAVSTQSDLV